MNILLSCFLVLGKIILLLWFYCKRKIALDQTEAGQQCHLDLFSGDMFCFSGPQCRCLYDGLPAAVLYVDLCTSTTAPHTYTHSPRPWDLGSPGLSLINSSLLVHQLGCTTSAGCACVTQVAVLQRFIPLQCCWEDVSHPAKCPVMKQHSVLLLQTWRVL